jgi:F-type H+-transporting ATPase subunit alpha
LFNSGIRPAINVGISVSRVGGSAQPKAMKKVAGRLRLDLAQFRELEAFAAFGSDLDAASKSQLERGSRLVQLLIQGQYAPLPMEKAVASLWAGTTGNLDDVPVDDIGRFEVEFHNYLDREHASTLAAIRDTRDLTDENIEEIKKGINNFKKQFVKANGQPLLVDANVDPLAVEDVEQAQIKVQKRA